MSSVEGVVDGLIRIISENIIARTNVMSDVLTGDILVNVENTLHFEPKQEVILIDYGYNDKNSPHHQKYEYAVIKEVINTHYLTLTSPIQDPSGGWMVSNDAFLQKTIAHSPLYEDQIFYGDQSVISTNDIAITVEPINVTNEWIYIQGGLSNEYTMKITIYGKDINTENGMRILNKYTDAVVLLLNKSIHIDINAYETPILFNVAANTDSAIIADTPENRERFVIPDPGYGRSYEIQDNKHVELSLALLNIEYSTPDIGLMRLTFSRMPNSIINFKHSYSIDEYAVLRTMGRYFYDTRANNIEYGKIQMGSAFIRASSITWFGKEVEDYGFAQVSLGVPYFKKIDQNDPDINVSSSSSSSIDSSSSSSS